MWKALQSSRLPAHSSAWDLQKRVPPPNELVSLIWQPALQEGIAEQPQLWRIDRKGHMEFSAFFFLIFRTFFFSNGEAFLWIDSNPSFLRNLSKITNKYTMHC